MCSDSWGLNDGQLAGPCLCKQAFPGQNGHRCLSVMSESQVICHIMQYFPDLELRIGLVLETTVSFNDLQ
jgi:hypothetical protein